MEHPNHKIPYCHVTRFIQLSVHPFPTTRHLCTTSQLHAAAICAHPPHNEQYPISLAEMLLFWLSSVLQTTTIKKSVLCS